MSAQAIIIEGDCPTCKGSGKFFMGICSFCKGTKRYQYRIMGQFLPYLLTAVPCDCNEKDCLHRPQTGG